VGFSERELTFTYAIMLSPVRPSVCLSVCVGCLSVTLVHPTQAVEIFGNFSTEFGTLPPFDFLGKFHGDRPSGTPPSLGGVKHNASSQI